MAVSLGFGILFATLLTLILVPVTYRIMEDARMAIRKILNFGKKAVPAGPQ